MFKSRKSSYLLRKRLMSKLCVSGSVTSFVRLMRIMTQMMTVRMRRPLLKGLAARPCKLRGMQKKRRRTLPLRLQAAARGDHDEDKVRLVW